MYESTLGLGHLLKPTVRDAVRECLEWHLAFSGVREWWTHPDREPMARDFEDELDRGIAAGPSVSGKIGADVQGAT